MRGLKGVIQAGLLTGLQSTWIIGMTTALGPLGVRVPCTCGTTFEPRSGRIARVACQEPRIKPITIWGGESGRHNSQWVIERNDLPTKMCRLLLPSCKREGPPNNMAWRTSYFQRGWCTKPWRITGLQARFACYSYLFIRLH